MEDKKYYYQIKGKSGDEQYSNWVFPPIFSGEMFAKDKKEARNKIELEYNKKFPLRVLIKDLDSNDFLLSLVEFNNYHQRLFDVHVCGREDCDNTFRVIDLYNDTNNKRKGSYCCEECGEIQSSIDYANKSGGYDGWNSNPAVIYKITNKNNNMCYIGQTTQSFTLRWWQHIKWGVSDNKFHTSIRESKITDWMFEVIEVVEDKSDLTNRESYWIKHYNSIEGGYNTATVNEKTEDKNTRKKQNE